MRKINFFSRLLPLIILASLTCFYSCDTTKAVVIKPTTWKEFHGNSLNSAFTNFETQPARVLDWQFPVGDVGFAAPVIDDDGAIYIGNRASFLFAINPDGTQRWKQNIGGGPLTSAALGADGNIYIINILTLGPDSHASILFSFKPNATGITTNWSFIFPDHGYTTAPPKTWILGVHIFIFVTAHTDIGNELFVIDEGGKQVGRMPVDCKPDELTGGNDFGFHVQGIEFDASNVTNPAAAVADIPGTTNFGKPFIVIAPDKCHLMAFEWDPREKKLTQKWTAPGAYYTNPSPVVTSGGVVIIGHEETLSAYDLITGNKFWDFKETSKATPNSFYDTPAIVVGTSPIVFDNSGYVLKVEGDGKSFRRVLAQPSIDGLGPPAVVSTNFIYAAFNSGLYTFDLALTQVAHVDLDTGPNKQLLSPPAIGGNGMIYLVDGAGMLNAFGERTLKQQPRN